MKNKNKIFLAVLLMLASLLFGCEENLSDVEIYNNAEIQQNQTGTAEKNNEEQATINFDLPAYSGNPYVVINNNVPYFEKNEITDVSFEKYSETDDLGRCGVCIASVGKDIMPNEERGTIGSVKPTGWHSVKYDNVDGKYLYNRCHLIGFQLTGENANEKNLITGTRYMNVEGMLPFENMVADYVKETGNHVMYRATPVFEGENLLASGVVLEGYSVEDNGDGISFCVFCYNVQPEINIDYSTGESTFAGTNATATQNVIQSENTTKNTEAKTSQNSENTSQKRYILNTNTKKFHYPNCNSVSRMKEENKKPTNKSREEIISDGYVACKNCNP